MMGFAANVLGWSPGVFYGATPHEYFAAYEFALLMNKKED